MQSDNIARIPLRAQNGSIRTYVIVDATDADWVNQWHWHLDRDGYVMRNSTPVNGKRTTVYLHRELLGLVKGDGIEGDHRDRDRLNCRRSNLRAAPRNSNAQNRSSYRGASSAYRGVSWNKTKRAWTAHIRINGKLNYLGAFESETEAARVAQSARLRLMPFAVD